MPNTGNSCTIKLTGKLAGPLRLPALFSCEVKGMRRFYAIIFLLPEKIASPDAAQDMAFPKHFFHKENHSVDTQKNSPQTEKNQTRPDKPGP